MNMGTETAYPRIPTIVKGRETFHFCKLNTQ